MSHLENNIHYIEVDISFKRCMHVLVYFEEIMQQLCPKTSLFTTR